MGSNKWFRCRAAFPLLASTAALQARERVSVVNTGANMRVGAGTQHATLWALTRGYPLAVTGRQAKWLKVRNFANDAGWVYRPLVGQATY